MKQHILGFILSLFFLSSQSQNLYPLKIENGDSDNAILIQDTIFGPTTAPVNHGYLIEFSGNAKTDSLFIEQEHHSVWYKFYAKYSGELTFDIIPQNLNDDYDFMLFKFNDSSFFRKIISKEIKPIRSNISRNDKKTQSATGISSLANNKFIRSGEGGAYSKSIYVKENELYYLIVDNVYKNGKGHTIKFHYNLNSLIEGKELTFNNIIFKADSDVMLASSNLDLEKLLKILQDNPSMKIEIQGHVNNAIKNIVKKDYNTRLYEQKLSEKRAQSVMNYLIKKNINKNRLTFIGCGSTRLIYPNAKTESELSMNRRVSILVISI